MDGPVGQEAVVSFQPSEGDLDYPGKLERQQAAAPGQPGDAEPQEQRPLVADNGEPSSSGDAMVRLAPCCARHAPPGAPLCCTPGTWARLPSHACSAWRLVRLDRLRWRPPCSLL